MQGWILIVSGDKQLCVFTMRKTDYQNKLHQMINDP